MFGVTTIKTNSLLLSAAIFAALLACPGCTDSGITMEIVDDVDSIDAWEIDIGDAADGKDDPG